MAHTSKGVARTQASVLKVADVVSHSTAIDALARSAQWQRALEARFGVLNSPESHSGMDEL